MIGKTISHYKILEKLGEGGMGVVYKAEDTKLKRIVALKFLSSQSLGTQDEKTRFVHEAQAAAALDHPNICAVHEIDESDGHTFIAMAYVDGQTLRKKTESGPLKLKEALDLATDIARGLQEAHENNIVHRDIKSANVMVTKKGQAKITDFGLAKLAGSTRVTKTGTTVGTVAYMSPEQASGEDLDHRSDIWSLGVVLYEMLTGQLPFRAEHAQAVIYQVVNEKPDAFSAIRNDIPAGLEQIVGKCLEKRPSDRYQQVDELLEDLGEGARTTVARPKKNLTYYAIPIGLAVLIASFFLVRQGRMSSRVEWAKNVALPQIEELTGQAYWENNIEAFSLAVRAEEYIPNDPELKRFLKDLVGNISVITQPPGAKAYRKPFDKPENDWEFIGLTPIVSSRMPNYFFRWKIEKEGYETVHRVFWSTGEEDFDTGTYLPTTLEVQLDKSGALPADMVRVPGTDEIGSFLIDRYEVTNQQFKRFMDNGGYQDRKYWNHSFVKNDTEISWQDALAEFRDMTERLGPATWEGGTIPKGEGDYPVSGISWYEAAAYAEFAGKSLPTVFHWEAARETRLRLVYHLFYPMSNFGGKGPVPVETTKAMTQFGLYDMAGNVREWCWNESEIGRCNRGGAWNDNTTLFGNIMSADPFDRSSKLGFRCAIYSEGGSVPDSLFEPIEYDKPRDFYAETPVSDAVFDFYRDMFSYDESDLMASVDETDEGSPDWIRQKISFSAAYGDERVIIHLFLPRKSAPPYQTVVYFPGAAPGFMHSSRDLENLWEFASRLSYLVKNGRAVVFPVYKGTFERLDGIESGFQWSYEDSHEFRNYTIKVVKDYKRTIDYLETRADVDHEKLAYIGMSWGGALGGFIPAIEERIKVSILDVGGFWWGRPKPEVDPINYVSRVTIPTLMLNGRFDMVIPYESVSKPMFDLLGTVEQDKRQIVYDTDHFIPRKELIKESLAWLDRYFGPVEYAQ